MDGWIKLHREVIEHWIYKDAEYLKVWLEMLVRARYWNDPGTELVGDQLIKVDRGEFIFGRPKWSQRLGISEQRLKTLIQKMIKEDMIEMIQKYPRCTLYRIKNYEKYNQHDNQQSNQQETLQPSGSSEDSNQQGNQQSNQRATSSQPAPNQQPTNNKESKERKNDKNDKKKDIIPKINFAEFVSLTQEEYDKLLNEHGEDRVRRMIEILDNYKGSTGKPYKSDYRAILNWVVNRVKEEGQRRVGSTGVQKYQGNTGQGYGGSNRKITQHDQTSRVREFSDEELAGLI